LNNKALDTKIEEKINEVTKAFSNKNKLDVELKFYQTVTNSLIFSQKLNNLWECWQFHFLLYKKCDNNLMKNESENQNQKENKIRKYLFEIIQKVNKLILYLMNYLKK